MRCRYLLTVLAVIMAVPINEAYGAIADLELTISPAIINDSNFGEVGEFSITVTNHGPDDAGKTPVPFPISVATELLFMNSAGSLDVLFAQNFNISQECAFFLSVVDPIPGNPPTFFYSFFLPSIPAGTSITCYGLYTVGFSSGRTVVEWDVFNPTDTDPVSENDLVTMSFSIAPPVIPTLSIWGILLLLSGVFYLSKRHMGHGL